MAEWYVSNEGKKSVITRETWAHPDKGEIIAQELFRGGTYIVTTEGDEPPKFNLVPYPGTNIEGCLNITRCGYPIESLGLDDGIDMQFIWPTDMGKEERDEMFEAWEEDNFDAWQSRGWSSVNYETWFLDDLVVMKVEPVVKVKKPKKKVSKKS